MTKRIGGAILLAAAVAACTASRINDYPVPRDLFGEADLELELSKELDSYRRAVAANDLRELFLVQGRLRLLAERAGGTPVGDSAVFYIGKIYYDVQDDYDARLTFLRHRRHYPDSPWRDEVDALVAEMDRRTNAYREWLEETRTGETRPAS